MREVSSSKPHVLCVCLCMRSCARASMDFTENYVSLIVTAQYLFHSQQRYRVYRRLSAVRSGTGDIATRRRKD